MSVEGLKMLDILTDVSLLPGLISGGIAACLCAFLGIYILIRRMVFAAIALSSMASLGLAMGFMLDLEPMMCAMLASCAAILLLWMNTSRGRALDDGTTGLIYAASSSIAVLIVARNPSAEASGLNLFSDNPLYSAWQDVVFLAICAVVVFGIHVAFRKEFIFIALDPEMAATTGLRVRLLDFLLYLTIGMAASVSIRITGTLYVFASLVIPPMIGRMVGWNLRWIIVGSVCVAALSAFAGYLLSFALDLPYSHTVVVLYSIMFFVTAAFQSVSNLTNTD